MRLRAVAVSAALLLPCLLAHGQEPFTNASLQGRFGFRTSSKASDPSFVHGCSNGGMAGQNLGDDFITTLGTFTADGAGTVSGSRIVTRAHLSYPAEVVQHVPSLTTVLTERLGTRDVFTQTFTGTYAIDAQGRGTLVLEVSAAPDWCPRGTACVSPGPLVRSCVYVFENAETYDFVLADGGHSLLLTGSMDARQQFETHDEGFAPDELQNGRYVVLRNIFFHGEARSQEPPCVTTPPPDPQVAVRRTDTR